MKMISILTSRELLKNIRVLLIEIRLDKVYWIRWMEGMMEMIS